MAANEILKFVETDTTTNLLTQAEYSADPQRDIGNQPGIARSKLVNKAMRQSSLIAAGIAQYVANKQALDVTDELTPAEFALMLTDALDAEFVKLSGATMSGALALFGGDTGVTPAQFDNDTSLATTAFVKGSGIQTSNFVSYAVASTIPASSCGKAIQLVPATAQTFTLPLTTDCPNGSILMFKNTGVGAALLSRAGGDVITQGSSTGVTLQIGSGDDLILISNGAGTWFSFAGSAQLEFTSEFLASRATNGYQKLPGGLIVQWGGSIGAIASGTSQNVTLPITFPNAALKITCSIAGTVAAGAYSCAATCTTTTATLSAFSGVSPAAVNFIVIGY